MENQIFEEKLKLIQRAHPSAKVSITQDVHFEQLNHCNITEGKVRGYGCSSLPEVALQIAYSEFIERICFWDHRNRLKISSTNGIAAHVDKELAYKSSLFELEERDSFLNHWHAGRSPSWLSAEDSHTYIRKFSGSPVPASSEYRFGLISKSNENLVAIGAYIFNSSGSRSFAIDCKCGPDLQLLMHSLAEGLLYYNSLVIGRLKHDLPPYGNKLVSNFESTEDHLNYYLQPENFIEHYFDSQEQIAELQFPQVNTSQLEIPIKTAWPLYVFRSWSEKVQDYYIGKPSESQVNSQRLQETYSTKLVQEKAHPLP